MRVRSLKMVAISLLSLTIFSESSRTRPQLLYYNMQSLSGFSLTPKQAQITSNGHFALKFVLGSACDGLRVLAVRQNCSEICRATRIYYTVSCKKCIAGTLVSGDTFCAVILWVSLNRERETGELCSQLSHILFTDVQKMSRPNIQEHLCWKQSKHAGREQ